MRPVPNMSDSITELKKTIDRSRRIVFFGGAGVSTASGIPDFRSEDGICSLDTGGASPEEILSAVYFTLHTAEFFDFYRRYMVHPEAEPNTVHRWLYELEKEDRLRGIVTQNIDGLHKIAGNKRVYELHGSIYRNYCVNCETSYPLEKIMEEKTSMVVRGGEGKPVPVVEGMEKYNASVVWPIISEGDSIGTVIFLMDDKGNQIGDVEDKLAQSAAGFLGKQMEE